MENKTFFLSLLPLFSFMFFFSIPADADQVAYTNDGKKVILKDDGTWVYSEETKNMKISYDFRNSRWGMNKSQVKQTEKIELVNESKDMLIYKGTVADFNCAIVYIFAYDKLVRTKYVIDEEHVYKNDYIYDYVKLKDGLQKKYGKPKDSKSIWKNDLYKDEPQDWGLAISIGHLVYFTTWETPRTIITLALYGENYEITLAIEYKSKELAELEEKKKEDEVFDDF